MCCSSTAPGRADPIIKLHSVRFSLFLLEAHASLIVQIAAEVLMKHVATVK